MAVCDAIVGSLRASLTVQGKVAHLFLISDVLHNSTAPVRNASRYRNVVQSHLLAVFEDMASCLSAAPSRLAQELLRSHVNAVLRAWRERCALTDDVLDGLRSAFSNTKGSGMADLVSQAEAN